MISSLRIHFLTLIEGISELDASIGVLQGLGAELGYDRLLSLLESGKAGAGDIS